jgi:hypothetical protein
MKNKLRIILLLISGILIARIAGGQGRADLTETLRSKFTNYCKKVPREEIYSHTDRSEYIAGETLWFSIYVIDRQTGLPAGSSSVAYVELLNSDNRPVVQKKIKLRNSCGAGELELPDTLSTGSYTMRAYTSWMKNFLPDNCFNTEILIYNVLSNKVIPEKIHSYRSIPQQPGNTVNNRYDGRNLTILTDNSKADSLAVYIVTDSIFRLHNNRRFYLFIQTHGIIDHTGSYTIYSDTTKLTIPRAWLSSGINQITAFSADGNPVAEKYIYTPKNEKQLLAVRVAGNYHMRDKATIQIARDDGTHQINDSVHLSISVSPYTGRTGEEDISDYMVFGSEYGLLPHYLINGRKINDIPSSSLDSILSGIRSNWIDWKEIINDRLPVNEYKSEKENSYLAGRLVYNDGKTHNNEIIIMCTPGKYAQFQYCRTDSSGNFHFITRADEAARDIILMPDRISGNPSIILASPFSDKYPVITGQKERSLTELPSYIPKWMINYQVETIYGARSFEISADSVVIPGDTLGFYGKPDFELVMSDYIRLPRMEEVFFEILPHVSLREKDDKYEILITDRIDNTPYITKPSLMIDGVLIKDAKLIADLDPEKVEKIDVIEDKYLVGKYLFPGIVNVITGSANFSSVELPSYMIRMLYRAADPERTFVSPDYSSVSALKNPEPDYRNTLFWNPSVSIGPEGKKDLQFWTSDNGSDYEINIQGLTPDGRMISAHKIIHVK